MSEQPAQAGLEVFGPLIDELEPGRSVYLPGATGEVLGLIPALETACGRLRGVKFVGCFVPGMNEFDYAGLNEGVRVRTFMLPAAMRDSFRGGRVDLTPQSYTGAARVLAEEICDVAVAHVAPPDEQGRCSLGICSDFAPLVWPRAARRVLVVNPVMPSMPRGPSLALSDADIVIQAPGPLVTLNPASPRAETSAIARTIADLIPNGAHFQVGIGGAPNAVWRMLRGHKGLILRSGMANDGLLDLAEAGALAEAGGHVVGAAYGGMELYAYLARTGLVTFATTPQTHGFAALAPLEKFHAINSALEVDLLGQANVEWQGGALSSGVGGAADFGRAAMASAGGRSIIALPATAKGGTLSRIVSRICAPSVSVARTDVDTIVTEFGIAELRGKSMDERAQALIAVAAPTFREKLEQAWRELRRTV